MGITYSNDHFKSSLNGSQQRKKEEAKENCRNKTRIKKTKQI